MMELLRYYDFGTIDLLGFFAGACIISSMILRKVVRIKFLLLLGSSSWLAYGIILQLLPVVVINSIICLTGIIEITRLLRNKRSAEIGTV